MLCKSLLRRGYPVGAVGVPGGSLREPGGTPTGEAIRDVLLHRHDVDLWAEALLYAAARAQLVSEIVRPSLDAGMVVVLDRYVDSSLAYQGHARGLGIDRVLELNHWATGGLLPGLTILLQLDAGDAQARRTGAPDRMERQGVEFQARVAEGYAQLARMFPTRIRALDAARPPAEVAVDVEREVTQALEAVGVR